MTWLLTAIIAYLLLSRIARNLNQTDAVYRLGWRDGYEQAMTEQAETLAQQQQQDGPPSSYLVYPMSHN